MATNHMIIGQQMGWRAWILTVCLSAAAAVHAAPAGHIMGIVNDATGAPLPGVTITVSGTADRVATTNQDGRFTFQQLPDGEYELKAALDRFVPAVRAVRLVDSKTEPLVLTLSVGAFEQVLVTAEKTGERDLQSAPMALSALSATDLQLPQVHTVADLAGRVPAVTFSQNSDFSQLTIRGLGTNVVFAGSDPSSAVYVDGVYLARPRDGRGRFPGSGAGGSPAATSRHVIRSQCGSRRPEYREQDAFEPSRGLRQVRGR
jgi:Carboxypeptidase regulatory-like domain/TonB-dependent Receptor Plug Domain